MKRTLLVFSVVMLSTTVTAAENATAPWPSVSKNQSRKFELKVPVVKRDVTANICPDLCYCAEDPRVTKVTNALCIQEDPNDKAICSNYLFYDCAKRTVNGRETCRTCI